MSTGVPIPAHWTCRRRCRYRADIEPSPLKVLVTDAQPRSSSEWAKAISDLGPPSEIGASLHADGIHLPMPKAQEESIEQRLAEEQRLHAQVPTHARASARTAVLMHARELLPPTELPPPPPARLSICSCPCPFAPAFLFHSFASVPASASTPD